MRSENKVAILLCTYNGEQYIRSQIDSIITQTYTDWVIYASDDGSTDNTIAILKEYQESLGKDKLIIVRGPRKGFAWNFMILLENVGMDFSYFAFSDQDDIWLENKLERAIELIIGSGQEEPTLYCGRTMLVDKNANFYGYSPLFTRKPSFRNALVQSIAGGNTMLFNRVTKNMLIKTSRINTIVSHDWWVYIVVTGCGGVVIYDETPTIKYRQHGQNIIGANNNFSARVKRLKGVFGGVFRQWIDLNILLLNKSEIHLSEQNSKVFEKFRIARESNLIKRVYMFTKLKMYRQTLVGTIALAIAVLFKKI